MRGKSCYSVVYIIFTTSILLIKSDTVTHSVTMMRTEYLEWILQNLTLASSLIADGIWPIIITKINFDMINFKLEFKPNSISKIDMKSEGYTLLIYAVITILLINVRCPAFRNMHFILYNKKKCILYRVLVSAQASMNSGVCLKN